MVTDAPAHNASRLPGNGRLLTIANSIQSAMQTHRSPARGGRTADLVRVFTLATAVGECIESVMEAGGVMKVT